MTLPLAAQIAGISRGITGIDPGTFRPPGAVPGELPGVLGFPTQMAALRFQETLQRLQRQADPLQQIRRRVGQIAGGLAAGDGGLPTPAQFLAGFTARQIPALAGARERLTSELALRGLTGAGAEIGALGGLEAQAAGQRVGALTDFLLQRPSLELGLLGQAQGILRGLRPPSPFRGPSTRALEQQAEREAAFREQQIARRQQFEETGQFPEEPPRFPQFRRPTPTFPFARRGGEIPAGPTVRVPRAGGVLGPPGGGAAGGLF